MRTTTLFIILSVIALSLFTTDLMYGTTDISCMDVIKVLAGTCNDQNTRLIVLEFRLARAVAAVIAGVALSVSALQMQTIFQNPLAGPYVLGISNGASLGVALFMMGAPLAGLASGPEGATVSITVAACAGAAAMLAVIMAVSWFVKNIITVLITGMMLGSGISAIVQILQYLSSSESVKRFVIWNMGSLGDVTSSQINIMTVAVTAGLLLTAISVKPLNMMLLGENYAKTMGISVVKTRMLTFTSTAILSGAVTAFCGPIGFIGLATPHIARYIFRNSDHRILLPATALTGIILMTSCNIISKGAALPINSITSLMGIPVVLVIILKRNKTT